MSALAPALLAGLLDDAAVFPPGDAPLDVAVKQHRNHLASPYAAALGPLVVRASDLATVGDVRVAVTTGLDDAHGAVAAAGDRLVALEVVLPATAAPSEVRSLASFGVDVRVEVPRDSRHDAVIAELGAFGLTAKFRTGGPTAAHHPSPEELAAGIAAAVAFAVPFKATAGLHHAVRHTAPATGCAEHGFLNLLVATALARAGASREHIAAALAERDEQVVAAAVRGVDTQVRQSFLSFGTCSVREPLDDLDRLGLLPEAWAEGTS